MSSVDKHMRQQLISLTTKLLDETTLRIQCEEEKDDLIGKIKLLQEEAQSVTQAADLRVIDLPLIGI
jgi:hypothetical protein